MHHISRAKNVRVARLACELVVDVQLGGAQHHVEAPGQQRETRSGDGACWQRCSFEQYRRTVLKQNARYTADSTPVFQGDGKAVGKGGAVLRGHLHLLAESHKVV